MRSTVLALLSIFTLGLALGGCGDDTGGTGGGSDDGADDGADDGGADDGTGSGDDTTGTGDATGGGGVDTCTEMCAQAPVSTGAEGVCVYEFMFNAGYPIATTSACQGVTDEQDCNDCYAVLQPTDADCAAAYAQCNE